MLSSLPAQYINDLDVWSSCPTDWLWIYDKLIVARKQGIVAGPAGVPVPTDGAYIVRPITNIRMMSRGAQIQHLSTKNPDAVPDGFFWTEILQGRHVSVDYNYGQQELTVEGFRDDATRLDRFSRWQRVTDAFALPEFVRELAVTTEWLNVEYIGSTAIELHLRYNDDFRNHDSDVIYPVWRDEPRLQPPNTRWYASAAGDRLGFWVEHKYNHADTSHTA
jgi:hypothetical protein